MFIISSYKILHGIALFHGCIDGFLGKNFKERVSDRNFGNGRESRSLLENATVFVAERVKKISVGKIKKRQFQKITVSNIRKVLERMRKSNLMQIGKNKKRKMGFA